MLPWCYHFYNLRRRHSSVYMISPIAYENLTADQTGRGPRETLHDPGEAHRLAGRASRVVMGGDAGVRAVRRRLAR
jgi:hypothetical protein